MKSNDEVLKESYESRLKLPELVSVCAVPKELPVGFRSQCTVI